jgi:hypothetical protein
MRRAWQIARATGKAFAVALSKSWQLYRLTKRMRAGVVRFAYEKAELSAPSKIRRHWSKVQGVSTTAARCATSTLRPTVGGRSRSKTS